MEHFTSLITNPYILTILIIVFGIEYFTFFKINKYLNRLQRRFAEVFVIKFQELEKKLYKEQEKQEPIHFRMNNIFIKILFYIISLIFVVLIEFFWELGFKKIVTNMENNSVSKRFVRYMDGLSPLFILIIFLSQFILMEVVGAISIIELYNGFILSAILIYISKFLFLVPVKIILSTQLDQLLTIQWFKRRFNFTNSIIKWSVSTRSYIKISDKLSNVRFYIETIINIIKTQIKLIRNTYKNGSIVSETCKEYYNEIKELKIAGKNIKKEKYENFFDCIDKNRK